MALALSDKLREFVDAAGAAVNSLKLNCVSVGRQDGRLLRIKRRRVGSEQIADLANLFFPAASAPIRVLSDPEQWQEWEVSCYRLLNGDEFTAFASAPRTVSQDKVPGRTLRKLNTTGHLTVRALEAAAEEIRRVHQLPCPGFNGRAWSHGDLHMGNVIYHGPGDRARLIDFEVIHNRTLPAVQRHADDLLAFVQEMIASVPGRQWLPLALCFLYAYDRPRVLGAVRRMLFVPDGVAGLWWKIRCNFCDAAQMRRRCAALQRALDS